VTRAAAYDEAKPERYVLQCAGTTAIPLKLQLGWSTISPSHTHVIRGEDSRNKQRRAAQIQMFRALGDGEQVFGIAVLGRCGGRRDLSKAHRLLVGRRSCGWWSAGDRGVRYGPPASLGHRRIRSSRLTSLDARVRDRRFRRVRAVRRRVSPKTSSRISAPYAHCSYAAVRDPAWTPGSASPVARP